MSKWIPGAGIVFLLVLMVLIILGLVHFSIGVGK